MTQARLLTYDEYLQLPYDGRRTEFIDGEVIELTPPRGRHTDITRFLDRKLEQYFEDNELPLVSRVYAAQVRIPQVGKRDRGRDPDLVVCTVEQWEALQDKTAVFQVGNPPLMVAEVVSPGNASTDLNNKLGEYADARIPEYWIVNALDGYITVWELQGRAYAKYGTFTHDEVVSSPSFPRLTLTVEKIFEAGKR
jgi:Uma2 family endonuclease